LIQRYLNLARSYIGYKTQLKRFLKPIFLHLPVTMNCNLRCPYCYVWRNPKKDELSLQEIKNILSNKVVRNLIAIAISGGEPFIRDDVVDIASAIIERIPNLTELTFATNGFFSEKIISNIHEILDMAGLDVYVKVSIDGLESKHDKIRGKGTFSKAMSTLEGLRKLKEKGHNLSVSIGFTVVDENIENIWEVYDKFKDEYDFFFKPAQTFPIGELPISEDTRRTLIEFTSLFLEREFKKKASVWQSSRKLYFKYLLDFLRHPNVRPVPCSASFSFLSILPDGNVYACSVSGLKLGNVREKPIDEIWYSPISFDIRKKIKGGDCTCCTACDLGPSILTCRWYKVMFNYITGALKR